MSKTLSVKTYTYDGWTITRDGWHVWVGTKEGNRAIRQSSLTSVMDAIDVRAGRDPKDRKKPGKR